MLGWATGRGWRRELFVAAKKAHRCRVLSLDEKAICREQILWRCVTCIAEVAMQWKRT